MEVLDFGSSYIYNSLMKIFADNGSNMGTVPAIY